jgi:hypothetical protein
VSDIPPADESVSIDDVVSELAAVVDELARRVVAIEKELGLVMSEQTPTLEEIS